MSDISAFLGTSTPIGGLTTISGCFDPAANPSLKLADGSDIVAADYPVIASKLPSSLSGTIQGLPYAAIFRGVAYGDGKYVALYGGPTEGVTVSYIVTSTDGVNWVVRSTIPMLPYCIAYINGEFLISGCYFGSTIYIYKSLNGISWYALPTIGNGGADTVTAANFSYQNGVYFLSLQRSAINDGSYHHFYYSTNSVTWTKQDFGGGHSNGRQIAFGNGVYVSVHNNGVTLSATSHTGTWTARTNTATGNGGWTSVCFGNGVFISVQGYTTAGTSVGYSTDGITWVQQTVPSGRYWKVIYANSIFVAIGWDVCATSTDGITWTARTVPTSNWIDVTYGASGFVAVSKTSDYRSIRSADGLTWTTNNITGPGSSWAAIAYGTALGYLAVPSAASQPSATSSDGGLTWVRKSNLPALLPASLASNPAGTMYVVTPAGATTFYSTPDAVTWTSRGTLASTYTIYPKVRWLNDKFVIAHCVTSSYMIQYIRWSYDGITWTDGLATGPEAGNLRNCGITGMAYGNGVYVGVTQFADTTWGIVIESKGVYTSSDGLTWALSFGLPQPALWSDVAFGNGVFVAISTFNLLSGNARVVVGGAGPYSGPMFSTELNGRMAGVSTDGVNWHQTSLPSSGMWSALTFDGNVFIAVDYQGSKIAVTKDGYHWNVRPLPMTGMWSAICSGSTGEAVVVPGNSSASLWAGFPAAAVRLTTSATDVMLPHPQSIEGVNYAVKVQ